MSKIIGIDLGTTNSLVAYVKNERPTPIADCNQAVLLPSVVSYLDNGQVIVGTDAKDDAADVAQAGYDAMMKGEGDVVAGWKNKLETTVANVTPAGVLAEQHRKMAEPGTAKAGAAGRK